VSPLIALMKDQVDSLRACGVPAIQLDSMQTAAEKFAHEQDVREGKIRLLFVSPERLVLTDIYQLLRRINVHAFAIDEAHCISHCIGRADVDELAASLQNRGHKVLPYHAGMSPEERKRTQESFATERCDIIVATVAFGMGINRSNIRFVLHAAMPKSMEHYQQETGRAGRDGLESECVLLYSGGDTFQWRSITEKSAKEAGAGADFLAGALQHL